jgi:hypothetical protein
LVFTTNHEGFHSLQAFRRNICCHWRGCLHVDAAVDTAGAVGAHESSPTSKCLVDHKRLAIDETLGEIAGGPDE